MSYALSQLTSETPEQAPSKKKFSPWWLLLLLLPALSVVGSRRYREVED